MFHSFKLFPSRIFAALLFTAYSLAFFVIIIIPILLPAKIGLVILLSAALVYYLRRDALLLLPLSPVGLRVEEGYVTVFTRSGSERSGKVANDSLVTPALTILNFSRHEAGKVRSIVIFPDSMEKEDFRKLRVLLKWGG